MLASWLGRSFQNKKNNKKSRRNEAATGRPRLILEALEDRSVPATAVWTGLAVGNLVTNPGTAAWSNPLNWELGYRPGDGGTIDDVIFPTGAVRVPATGDMDPATVDVPNNTPFTWNINSLVDQSYTIRNLTINSDNYRIDATGPFSLTITGSITVNISTTLGRRTGYSIIGLPPNLPGTMNPLAPVGDFTGGNLTLRLNGNGNAQFINNLQGVLEIAADITELSPSGLTITTGGNTIGGTTVLSGNNTFTGIVTVQSGARLVAGNDNALGSTAEITQVLSGGTLGITDGAFISESLTINGAGVNGQGAINLITTPFIEFARWPVAVENSSARILGNVTLATSSSIGSETGASFLPAIFGRLTISGVISGSSTSTLTKVGGEYLRLTSANTYAGDTIVQVGELEFTNNTSLGTTQGITRVQFGASLYALASLTVSENLFLNGPGSRFELSRNLQGSLVYDDFFTLGGTLRWLGTITLESDATIGATPTNTMFIDGALVGTGDLTKAEQGRVIVTGANTNFRGDVFIENGALQMTNAQALGPATAAGGPNPGGSITVEAGIQPGAIGFTAGTLELTGDFTILKSVTLNGPGSSSQGALNVINDGSMNGSNIVLGALMIASATSIGVDGGSTLEFAGIVSGPAEADIEKNGEGILILSANNTYLGATTLQEGTTIIKTATALGGAGGAGTTVAEGATLQLANALNVANESLVLSGLGFNNAGALLVNGTGISTWTGEVNLLNDSGAPAVINIAAGAILNFPNTVSGDANLRKVGVGELQFTGTTNNTLAGTIFIDEGTLTLGKINATAFASLAPINVGDGSGGNNSAILRLLTPNQIPDTISIDVDSDGLFNLNNQNETIASLSLDGGEVLTGLGTLTLGGNVFAGNAGPNIITGNLSLGSTTRTFTVDTGATLQVNGPISGGSGAGLTKTGNGVLIFGGVNTYSGTTTISVGTIQLAANNALPNSALAINGGGTFDVNGRTVTVRSLSGSGTLMLGSGVLTFGSDNSNQTFSGAITGDAANSIIFKVGTGTQTLSGNGSGFDGRLSVNGGRLLVTNNFSAADFFVATGASLGGSGPVGSVVVRSGAALSPGTSPGTFTVTGDLVLDPGAIFTLELNGLASFDQVVVSGNVNLNGALLQLIIDPTYSAASAVGDSFAFINASGTISGNFANVNPTTRQISAGGIVFQVNPGNTTLTVVGFAATSVVTTNVNPASPGQPVTLTAVITGVGHGTIDGTVQFFDNGVPIGTPVAVNASGVAQLTTSFATAGTHVITARYTTGTSGYIAPDAVVAIVVSIPTVTTVQTLNPTSTFGTNVTLVASVNSTLGGSAVGGSVTFVNATTGAVLGVAALVNGSAVLVTPSISVGTSLIQAFYSPGANYRTSSAVTTQVIRVQERYAVAAGEGAPSFVRVYNPLTGGLVGNINPFPGYMGGVKVAVGDVNGDGVSDIIVSAGPGAPGGHIKVFDGTNLAPIFSFLSFPGYAGGMNIAAGDVNGDGRADIITGTAAGFDHVKVFSGTNAGLMMSFLAYGGSPLGITVGAGDINGDGRDDVITGTATTVAHVKAFSGATGGILRSFLPFGGFTGGVFVAGGDLNGDRLAEIVVGSSSLTTHVKTFDGATGAESASFLAYGAVPIGVRVGTVDRNGDGLADIITGPGAGAPHVKIFSGPSLVLIDSFIGLPPGQPGSNFGIYVAGGGN